MIMVNGWEEIQRESRKLYSFDESSRIIYRIRFSTHGGYVWSGRDFAIRRMERGLQSGDKV